MSGDPLLRARREIDAAQYLVEGGFTTQATSRAYYEDDEPTSEDVQRSIADAERFVDAVAARLDRRRPA